MKTFFLLPQQIKLDEIVFRNRNKKYGAYDLRTHYNDEVNKALVISLSAIGLMIIAIYFFQNRSEVPFTNSNELFAQTTTVQNYVEPEKPITKNSQPPKGSKSTLPPVITADKNVKQTDTKDTSSTFGTHDTHITSGTGDSTNHVSTKVEVAPQKKTEPFKWAEVMPMFPGGEKELMKFLSKHLVYPHLAQSEGAHGKVILNFVVNVDGTISDIKVLRDEPGYGCADVAIKAVQQMPKWNPGVQNGVAVPVSFNLPVTFALQ